MTERHTDELLDAAIDSVAREWVKGDPSPGFASRVRLAWQPRIDRTSGNKSWQPRGIAAAAAAAILIVVLLLRWTGPDVSRDRQPQIAGRDTTATPPSSPAAPRAPTVPHVTAPSAVARRMRSRPEPWRIPVDESTPRIAALSEITDLTVTVNQPASLTLADLDVPDLAVAPLDPDRLDKELP